MSDLAVSVGLRGSVSAEFLSGMGIRNWRIVGCPSNFLNAGLGYGAHLLHVPHTWIVVGGLILVGLGVMSAVSHTKQRDPPEEPPPHPDA